MEICDFANSYLYWTASREADLTDDRTPGHMPWPNNARIQLDSRCQIIDDRAGTSKWYYLITACRTEWMYRTDTLWQVPNHEFCGFWSDDEVMAGHVMSNEVADFGGDMRVVRRIKEHFEKCEFRIRHHPGVRRLESDREVVQATEDYLPIIARTEISSDSTGLRAIIEYPVKTMNVQTERQRMQVDTGPMIFADLDASVDRDIERLSMAYVCYNNYDVAEFVLRKPTPVLKDGDEVGSAVEYSEVRRVPTKTTLYSAGEPAA